MSRSLKLLLCLTLLLTFVSALATQEVVAPRVRVLYDDPSFADYAQEVARDAEAALDILADLFDYVPETVVFTLETDNDVFNAFAPPLPRPKVALRSVFPTTSDIGYRTGDALYMLLLHELTHSVQLTYTERPPGAPVGIRLGLVGETAAMVPPSWFLEGIATWVESEYTDGGREDDALTVGLQRTAALGETWPGFEEAGLITYAPWPGGLTRYLYGAGFIDFLVSRYGFEAILETLRAYNAGGFFGDFSGAWRRTQGSELSDLWDEWRSEVADEAAAFAETAVSGETVTQTGWYTRAPALSPDGTRLAWASWPPAVSVADVVVDGVLDDTVDDAERVRLVDRREIIGDRLPETLRWLDERTLVYARVVPQAGTAFSEVMLLDVVTGEERQVTEGARAHLPTPTPNGCILYVRNAQPQPSQLQRWCDGAVTTLWRATAGEHLLGLAVSDAGQIALSVWRRGFVDLVLLQNGDLYDLTRDAAQDLDPVWQGETALLFRSDRDTNLDPSNESINESPNGVFDLYRLDLTTMTLTRLTRSVGGALQPEVHGAADDIWYVEQGANGYNLAVLTETLDETVPFVLERLPTEIEADAASDDIVYPVRPYRPLRSLAPYGWLPTAGGVSVSPFAVAAEVTVFAQDDSAQHSYGVSLGYDSTLSGALVGGYGFISYDYRENSLLNAFGEQYPLGFGVQAGAWPQQGHLSSARSTALGVFGEVRARVPRDRWLVRADVRGGVVWLEPSAVLRPDALATLSASQLRGDIWGYPTRGRQFSAVGILSATPDGVSPGLWGRGLYYRSASEVIDGLPGTFGLGARAGYRPSLGIPVRPQGDLAASLSLGYRYSPSVTWRYGDGRYALERISLEPRVRSWLDTSFHVGADVTASLDTVIGYGAPVSFGVTVGYAEGLWYRFGARLPL